MAPWSMACVHVSSTVSSAVPCRPSGPTQPFSHSGSCTAVRPGAVVTSFCSHAKMSLSPPWQRRQPATIGRVGKKLVLPKVYVWPLA
jgi:hypothetical protein